MSKGHKKPVEKDNKDNKWIVANKSLKRLKMMVFNRRQVSKITESTPTEIQKNNTETSLIKFNNAKRYWEKCMRMNGITRKKAKKCQD